jgi:hypothetical protein
MRVMNVFSSLLPPGPTIPPLPAGLQHHDVLNAMELEYRPGGRNRRGKQVMKVVCSLLPPGPTIPPLPAGRQRMDMLNAVEAGDWLAVG